MRILLLVHNLDLGGAQNAVFNLATGLVAAGIDVTVLPWRRGGVLVPKFAAAGITPMPAVAEDGGWTRLRVPRAIGRIIAREGIDLVHAHMSDSALWAVIAQRLARRPAVVTHHTNDLIDTVGLGRPAYGWARRRLLFHCVRRAAANIAVSESVRGRLATAAAVPPDSIDVVPNGIPVPPAARLADAIQARQVRHGGTGTGAWPKLIFVGRLVEVKGLDTLIAAAAGLVESFPRACVQLVGDGHLEAGLRAEVARRGLTQNFDFRGFVPDVAPLLAEADVMVSPSRVEGLPLAVLEGMAWGLPIVATDIPGHRDLISGSETGLLVPPDTPAALADAVRATLADWPAAAARGRAARDLAEADYGVARMALRHREIYERVLAAWPAGVA